MDEVDIDNVEDLNELESRLYAQIHHEPTNETNTENRTQLSQNIILDIDANVNKNKDEANSEIPPNTNKTVSKRYWAGTESASNQTQQNSKHHFIRNPFKAPNKHDQQQSANKRLKHMENISKPVSNPFKEINADKSSNTETDSVSAAPPLNVNNGEKKKQNANDNQLVAKQKQTAAKSDLKLNPIADWMKRKKNHVNKKANGKSNNVNAKNSAIDIKQGLFSRQQQKLEKAKRLEEKKKRSKKAKNFAASLANKVKPTEIIDLDSDNDSESSDVILIPTAPPPTFTVDDSGDEDEKEKVNSISMENEENAVDSTDVQLSSTTASFIKPKEISAQSLAVVDGDEKRLENSSRCTSPCSIQSSDDFIRNVDRVRLKAGARGTADDEDLIELTSDINILEESGDISIQTDDERLHLGKSKSPTNDNAQGIEVENVESIDLLNPETPIAQSKDYRVDQNQYKALDVYESESDITDSVYSKGVNKSTVIRQIDSSSDDVENISICSQRTKRLHKRRASSTNKESDHNNENLLSSSDSENEEDDNKVLKTPVPYIAKGLAVERYKPQKRNRPLSFSSPNLRKSKTSSTIGATEKMSDTEFLATLSNLAHGQDENEKTEHLGESEESETENVPTAREIAEKILGQQKENEKTKQSVMDDDTALPADMLSELDEVFEKIDQFDKKETNTSQENDALKISDSSDSDRENNLIYQSVPDEDAQIIKYSPKNTTRKTHDKNGSPIYNVIYIRGLRKPGGIGWNSEMRKFYDNSWNGEHFIISKVLQKMNPEKNLWKIYSEDRYSVKTNRRSNIKCMNCCEFGHMRSKCKRPKKPMICYMCGESGHCEPRCPNTICLRCGNKTQVFTRSCNACSYQNRLTCPICKIRGHSVDFCPDKWRRYHSTTEANVNPTSKVDYNPRKYCCICGARGHLSDYCRSALRFLEYPATTSSIKSHQKSYSDVVVRSPYNGIAVNLMYEPCEEYKFDLIEQTSQDKYYGRFLKAVGLDFLLKRKRYSSETLEKPESASKKAKRLSKKYEANPYLKAAAAKQKNNESKENAPNQVQEISESGSIDQQNDESHTEDQVIDVEATNEKELELIDSGEEEGCTFITEKDVVKTSDKNFKSPKAVDANERNENDLIDSGEEEVSCNTKYKSPKAIDMEERDEKESEEEEVIDIEERNEIETELIDSEEEEVSCNITLNTFIKEKHAVETSDKNFKSPKVISTNLQEKVSTSQIEPSHTLDSDSNYSFSEHFDEASNSVNDVSTATEVVNTKESSTSEQVASCSRFDEEVGSSRLKPREMEALPDFIPLVDSTEEQNNDIDNTSTGISTKFVSAELDDEDMESNGSILTPLKELPCEAKIYLTHFHSKYLLSPRGNQFLVKTSRAHKLTARLEFTSVGHVLIIFGFPSNQDKFQRELLLKYRELEDEMNQRQNQGSLNVPKRTYVLIKFLRENIIQLMNNLGNVNQLLKRLHFLERQQTKTGFKLAEKVRRSLNMILVGQAGLQDGTMHLDRLLVSLKKLLNDVNGEVAPPELRSEITDHFKVIFSAYRHDNYQKMVETYNQLISKNRLPQLNIDPLLLGQKILDTNFSEEQKQKIEDTKTTASTNTETSNSLSQKNVKNLKRKQTTDTLNLSKQSTSNKPKQATLRAVGTSASPNNKGKVCNNASTPVKAKTTNLQTPNKTPQTTSSKSGGSSKKQTQKVTGVSTNSNTEKRSTVNDKWQNACDTLLTEITSGNPVSEKNSSGKIRDSKMPSPFWSRESMRYLDDCIRLASLRRDVVEKLQRVQNKSKNGQLSYNDYLAVIKLHTALHGK